MKKGRAVGVSKILIIEDEVAIADLEKDYLELSDFQVDICNSGDGGLSMALEGEYNLVILDLMLPGIDGFEVCRKIREEKNIPILMVSAKKDDIDKTARRVYVNGEERVFTTKEFDLLTFLAVNPNHVFTKEELFREIWDMDSIGDIATVTVHIKKIREKIEPDTAKPQYIETIWGVGYRFKV